MLSLNSGVGLMLLRMSQLNAHCLETLLILVNGEATGTDFFSRIGKKMDNFLDLTLQCYMVKPNMHICKYLYIAFSYILSFVIRFTLFYYYFYYSYTLKVFFFIIVYIVSLKNLWTFYALTCISDVCNKTILFVCLLLQYSNSHSKCILYSCLQLAD